MKSMGNDSNNWLGFTLSPSETNPPPPPTSSNALPTSFFQNPYSYSGHCYEVVDDTQVRWLSLHYGSSQLVTATNSPTSRDLATGEVFSAGFFRDRILPPPPPPTTICNPQPQPKEADKERVNIKTTYSDPTVPTLSSHQQPYDYGSRTCNGSVNRKIKFLCSFGGKILPRPCDGKLRYVGGETKIVSIQENLTFRSLKKKTSEIYNQPYTIKYQLPGKDQDTIISVCSEDDIHHMIEEYDDYFKGGSQRLRIFLEAPKGRDSLHSLKTKYSDPTRKACNGPVTGKIKFLCSFGGKILPRPSDGKLRYVGGETRIVSITENLTFSALEKKTSAIYHQPYAIKYQLPGEDLDTLVSVCSEEDVQHMIEEYHDHFKGGSQRLRIFLVAPAGRDSWHSLAWWDSNDANFQYFVAVNGMGDQKSSSGSAGY